jgi:hypothetical protein
MSDDYPTDEELAAIEAWPGSLRDLMAFVRALWWAADWGWSEHYDTDGAQVYEISTAGWSGNETLIAALRAHKMFWLLCWRQTRRGGHYTFSITGESGCHDPQPPRR